MPDRLVLGLTVAVALLTVVPAAADELPEASPVRFEGDPGAVIAVEGSGRFFDTVEVRSRPGREPVVVNELPIETYLLGIAEMPSRWPIEALRAQAVAARTYAWHVRERETYEGYDICATVACQVFRGADVVLDDDPAGRWRAAVEDTAGEVLLDGAGRPVLARYFSTSGGTTYANEEVFPGDGAHDHLVGIEDPYDAVSPLHRWEARFTREEFDAIVARGDTLGGVAPVVEVERLGGVRDQSARLRFTGEDGSEIEVSARAFQDFVSRTAPRLFPDRFPGPRADGRPLPATIPSTRFVVEVGDDEVVVRGQGWGHGVGLGQYGARGRAADGHDYEQILAAYYNGLEPTTSDALPERIRVGLDVPDGPVSVRVGDVVRILAGGEVAVEAALGTWTVAPDGDGWRLLPPEGHGEQLSLSDTAPAPEAGDLTDAVVVQAALNKPARLWLEVTDPDGGEVTRRPMGLGEAGIHAATWRLDDDAGESVAPGTYLVAIRAEDATGTVDGAPTEVEVPGPLEASHSAPSAGDDVARPGLLVLLVVAAVVMAGLAVTVLAVRTSRFPSSRSRRRA